MQMLTVWPSVDTFASYLLQDESSSLKAPALPSVALQTTSRLNGRVYVAAGKAGGALHGGVTGLSG